MQLVGAPRRIQRRHGKDLSISLLTDKYGAKNKAAIRFIYHASARLTNLSRMCFTVPTKAIVAVKVKFKVFGE
jgi:hypothetical protein